MRISQPTSSTVIVAAIAAVADHPIAALVLISAQILVLLGPVLAAMLVLGWHGIRGSSPGPAGKLLIEVIRIIRD